MSADHKSGIIISDVSDHFFTFIELNKQNRTPERVCVKRRSFTDQNINRFKMCLAGLSWRNVTTEKDTDKSFEKFWNDFKMFYDLCFPLTHFKFNKNKHKIQNFMTLGLLTSRTQKNKLHKISLLNPTQSNIDQYRLYRNIYNRLVRAMKKLYYEDSLSKNIKNPKKHGIF